MTKTSNKKERTGPKKPLTAFIYFHMKNRPKVLEENPGMKFGEIAKTLGAKWKAMSDAEKLPYKNSAEEDLLRFKQETDKLTKVEVVPVVVVAEDDEDEEDEEDSDE